MGCSSLAVMANSLLLQRTFRTPPGTNSIPN